MKTTNFKYSSLHDYLETVLRLIPNPTHTQIKQAKKEYWKLYYLDYRREKRKVRKEFTLGFNKQRLQAIHHKKGTLSVSKFLYQLIDRELTSEGKPLYDTDQLAELHLKLMQLIGLIEALLEIGDSELNEELLERLEVLEHSFSQLINS